MMTDFPTASPIVACEEQTADWTPVYDAFVAKLRTSGIGARAPRIGALFPDFALPDDQGRYRRLDQILARGPAVLSFNRGGWCSYCRSELSAWGDRRAALAEAGGVLVSIAGETGGRAVRLHDLVGPSAEVLVDVDHGLALAMGLAFRCDADLQRRYLACGLDLTQIYGSGGWFLPVPATYVVAPDRRVRFAFVDPDFRVRAAVDEVLTVVRAVAAEARG